jgi:hypothetical protein
MSFRYPNEKPNMLNKEGNTSQKPAMWTYEIYDDGMVNATFISTTRFQNMVIEHRLGK